VSEGEADLDRLSKSVPKIVDGLFKLVKLSQEYSSMYDELEMSLKVKKKLMGPIRGPLRVLLFKPKRDKHFCELRLRPYPHFEDRGVISEVLLEAEDGGKPLVRIYYKPKTSAGTSDKKYDLSNLYLDDLIELAYNLGDVIDEMVAMLEGWKSKLASALEVAKAMVAQLRLLTESD
jgi:hypothetical protein